VGGVEVKTGAVLFDISWSLRACKDCPPLPSLARSNRSKVDYRSIPTVAMLK
jgi:hypothetical protein